MRNYYPKFRIGCMEDGKIWFVPYVAGAVFELDIKRECVNFLSMLPVKKYINYTEGAMIKHENKIYFAPCKGEDFLIYDISKDQFIKLQCRKGGINKFQSGFYQDGNVYFIGQEQALIARFDLKKERVYYIDEFQKEPACHINSEDIHWSKGGACINGEHLLIPNVINSYILDYNIKENHYVLHGFDMDHKSFGNIVYVNHVYWLFPEEGNMILRWDFKSGTVRYIKIAEKFAATAFMHAYVWNEDIVIIDHQFLDVYFWDTEREVIKYLPVKEKLQIEPRTKGLEVRWSYIWDSKLFLNIMQRDSLIKYDLEAGTVKEICMKLSKESVTRYMEEFQKIRRGEYDEKIPYISVMSLLEKGKGSADENIDRENIGKRIFWNISNQL